MGGGGSVKGCGVADEGKLILDVLGPAHFVNTANLGRSSLSMKGGVDWDESLTQLTLLSSELTPSMSTRVRASWAERAGFTVVPVNFAEWESRPSTDEKMDLLASKGIPIPRHLY